MKHKTITRLLIKLMGVYFLIAGGVSLVMAVVLLIFAITDLDNFGGMYTFAYPTASGLSSLASIAAGLFLLLASNWLVSKLIPSNRPYCPNCGYELTGMRSGDCPECGVALPQRGQQPAPALDESPGALTP